MTEKKTTRPTTIDPGPDSSDRTPPQDRQRAPSSRGAAWVAVALAMLVLGAPRAASASPWTVPDDELTILTSLDFSFADEEYLPNGERQAFPLEGEYLSAQFSTTLRYGFTDQVEGGAMLRPKFISFQTNPVILPKDTDQPSRDLLDFSSQRYGLGDVDLFLRYQLFKGFVVVSGETRGQLPTGYESPQGTFKNDDPATNTIEDDATLGDGRAHLQQSFFAGTFVPTTKTFVRADVGYRLIFGGVGDQARGGLKIGQSIMGSVILFAGVRGAYTVYEGDPIGDTAIAIDPSVPSESFDGSNIRVEPLTLDRNYLKTTAGVIVPLQGTEFQLSYSRLLAGVNIPVFNTVSLGVSTRFPNVTGENEGE